MAPAAAASPVKTTFASVLATTTSAPGVAAKTSAASAGLTERAPGRGLRCGEDRVPAQEGAAEERHEQRDLHAAEERPAERAHAEQRERQQIRRPDRQTHEGATQRQQR